MSSHVQIALSNGDHMSIPVSSGIDDKGEKMGKSRVLLPQRFPAGKIEGNARIASHLLFSRKEGTYGGLVKGHQRA